MRRRVKADSAATSQQLRPSRGKIRILTIIGRLNIGGPAIQVASITEHFNRGEFECLLVAGRLLRNEGDMSYLAEEHGVKPLFIRSLSRDINPLRDIVAFLKILGIILKFRPHIVHTHTAKSGTLGRVAGFLAGVPAIVHTFHGHTLRHYFGKIKTKIFSSIERLLARITDAVITTSPSLCRDLVKTLRIVPVNKGKVIWFGIDLAPFLSSEKEAGRIRSELSIPRDAPVVTIVARLCPIKDHALFLRSAAVLLCQKPDAHFLIVGDGELRAGLERLSSELGIGDNVHFLGWRRDLAAIYADSTVAAITSLNEATTVTLIEAMACRKPVVATAVGGVPDIFPGKKRAGHLIHARTGILVDSRSPEVFAEAVLALVNDEPLRERMGRAGREFAKGNLSMEKSLEGHESLYRHLLRRRS